MAVGMVWRRKNKYAYKFAAGYRERPRDVKWLPYFVLLVVSAPEAGG